MVTNQVTAESCCLTAKLAWVGRLFGSLMLDFQKPTDKKVTTECVKSHNKRCLSAFVRQLCCIVMCTATSVRVKAVYITMNSSYVMQTLKRTFHIPVLRKYKHNKISNNYNNNAFFFLMHVIYLWLQFKVRRSSSNCFVS